MVVLGFASAIAVGTVLLMLPISKQGPGGANFVDALFTATSAVCVTGLTTVDTVLHWTPFGQVVIMLLIQLGGLGIMIFASLIGLVLARKLSVRSRMNAVSEAKAVGFADVRGLVRGIVKKYKGTFSFSYENGYVHANVLLPLESDVYQSKIA